MLRIKDIRVGKHRIGEGRPPFIIAECGINHNGQLSKAKQIAAMARRAGATCVKFQTHIVEKEMVPTEMRPGKISKERLWDIIKRCELTPAQERELKRYCDRIGIQFLSTPFSREAADQLERLGVPAYKIGSGELTNYPLIAHIARKGKPVILSTGMATMDQIAKAVRVVRARRVPLAVMLCSSVYPARPGDIRLGQIEVLRKKFKVLVGSSDHTPEIYTALGAAAKGACILEKHVTVSRRWPGPDQKFSLEFDQLRELVTGANAIHRALGGAKGVLPEEKPVFKFARASVVTIRPVSRGEKFSLKNIWVKRPGDGEIPPWELDKIIGKRAARDLPEEVQLRRRDLRS